MVKILQLICSTGFYGAERWILALANNLDRDVVSCDLLAISENSSAENELLSHYPERAGSIFRVEMKNRFDLGVVGKIARIVKQQKIDIIHTHGYKSDIIGILVAKKTNTRCISTPHGFGEKHDTKLRIYLKAGQFAFRFMDCVVPLSRQLFDDLSKLKVDPSKLVLIPNGVDFSELDAVDTQLSKPSVGQFSSMNVGFVGRLVSGKQVDEILLAFDKVWELDNTASLTIIGDGELRQELETMARSLPSAEQISFMGFRPDRIELMKKFDIFAMTSTSEGIPRSMMEAMALELPVVAYDVTGVDQLVCHERTGMLAELGDRESLTNHMIALLTDGMLAKRLGVAGRRHVLDNFSAASMASSYTELYIKLIEDNT